MAKTKKAPKSFRRSPVKADNNAKTRAAIEARKIIAEIAEMPVNEIEDSANFNDDMGIDSMKALELVALIEKKFKIKIPEDKIQKLRTPKNVYDLIAKTGK
jgi:acyl carrier protein